VANDTVNHGASVAQEPGVVQTVLGLTSGPGTVDNWTGNHGAPVSGNHILTEDGDFLNTEGDDRLITEG
jgi:hypothetical protein